MTTCTNSTANTNLRLPPHTDLPTRETPPGFQFSALHRKRNHGGNSTMADGAAVAADFELNHPSITKPSQRSSGCSSTGAPTSTIAGRVR